MELFELTHVFYRDKDEVIYSPKLLGIFESLEKAEEAVRIYKEKPGFEMNPESFSIRRRKIEDNMVDGAFYEAIFYVHSEDFGFEFDVELGVFAKEKTAEKALSTYCEDNSYLVSSQDMIVERVINKRYVNRMDWIEGFTI